MTIQLKSIIYTLAFLICGAFFTATDVSAVIDYRAVPGWIKCCECKLREFNNQLIRDNKKDSTRSCIASSLMDDINWKKCTDQTNEEKCHSIAWHATSELCEPFTNLPASHNCSEQCKEKHKKDCSKPEWGWPRTGAADCIYYEDGYTGETYDKEYERNDASKSLAEKSMSTIRDKCDKKEDRELESFLNELNQLKKNCESAQWNLVVCMDTADDITSRSDYVFRHIHSFGISLNKRYIDLETDLSNTLNKYKILHDTLYSEYRSRANKLYSDSKKIKTKKDLETVQNKLNEFIMEYSKIEKNIKDKDLYSIKEFLEWAKVEIKEKSRLLKAE